MDLTLADMAGIGDADFRRIFRRSAIFRLKAANMRRNALAADKG